jgi:hypothetical protein
MSLSQARQHSPAQLKLLRAAARRVRAADNPALMNSAYVAFAAVMTKGGGGLFKKLQKEWQRLAEP